MCSLSRAGAPPVTPSPEWPIKSKEDTPAKYIDLNFEEVLELLQLKGQKPDRVDQLVHILRDTLAFDSPFGEMVEQSQPTSQRDNALIKNLAKLGIPENFPIELTSLLLFGGQTLTATDAAVAAGLAEIGDPAAVAHLPPDLVRDVIENREQKIEDAVDRMKTEGGDVPLIAVGGAGFLVPNRLDGISEVIRVPHGDCANAVGAAIAQVSGETDQIYRDLSRADAIAAAETQARSRAVAAGASPESLQTVDVEDMPLAYLPGNALRVRVRVAGEMISPDLSRKGEIDHCSGNW